MCNTSDLVRIFQQVSRESLEHRRVWWAVVGEDAGLPKLLQGLIREGVQMALLVADAAGRYKFYVAEVSPLLGMRMKLLDHPPVLCATPGCSLPPSVGTTHPKAVPALYNSSQMDQNLDELSYRKPDELYRNPDEVYRNFSNRLLVIAALPTITFFNYTADADGKLVPEGGVDVQIVATLAKMLNFRYVISEPTERVWGGPQKDGNITGLVGHVAKRKAHFSMCKITITAERAAVVDFTTAYFTEGYAIVTAAPTIVGQSMSILRPFTYPVWGLLIAAVGMMGPITFTITKVGHSIITNVGQSTHSASPASKNTTDNPPHYGRPAKLGVASSPSPSNGAKKQGFKSPVKPLGLRKEEAPTRGARSREWLPLGTLPEFCFNAFRSVVNQGNLIHVGLDSVKVLFVFWYIFCLIVIYLYSGSLTAGYAVPTYSATIDSLEQVVAAGRRGQMVPLMNFQNSLDTLFKSSPPGSLYRAIADLYVPGVTYAFPVETGARYEALKRGGYTSFNSYGDARALTLQAGRRYFHIGRELFYFQSYGTVLPSGAPYKGVFDDALLRIVEAGLPNRFLEERLQQILGVKLYLQERSAAAGGGGLETSSISLRHTQGAFFVLLGGCGVGFLSLVGEIFLNRRAMRQ
ncbi:Ionotropic receptor 213 [Hyalella azteca]|uniref:Glutamate receptor ionotropic, delta-1 n=1 Tax=Hyalella azteca TaxID=294128 RepID=A0A6A0GWL5_HYAAZ|nr:glutamate receptor ionotropic, delta-1 [Hyalella azteca]KAA0190210.1 Ionotropic receptor 213 [Hyalella azteca]